jgi:hypothetical protein
MKTRKNRFKLNDYNSNDGFLTSVWGAPTWLFLHTISFNYPVEPTEEQKIQYLQFFNSLKFVLPCGKCRDNLTTHMEQFPLTMEHMKSRLTFSKYVYELHEKVNKALGKSSGLSYTEVRDRFEHFRSRCSVKGCVNPLKGIKSRCVLKIVPATSKVRTLSISKKCIR